MKNVTFSVDDTLLEEARNKARNEHRSLNDVFRSWLQEWTQYEKRSSKYIELMEKLESDCDSGGPFSRDIMNER